MIYIKQLFFVTKAYIYFLNKDFYEIGFKLKDFGDGKNLKELSCYIFDIHVCDFNENEFIFIKEISYGKRENRMSIDKFILNEKNGIKQIFKII